VAAADRANPPRSDALRVRPTPGSTLLVIAAIGTAVVIGDVFVAARRTVGWAFATIIVAWLLSAIIDVLCRWMRRGVALIVTVLAVAVLGFGTWAGVMASLRSEVHNMRTSLPAAAHDLEVKYDAAAKFRLEERVQSFVDELDKRFSTRAAVSKTAGTLPAYFVTGVLLLFFLGYGPRYLNGALKQIRDQERRDQVAAVFARASHRARRYVLLALGQVLAVVAVATAVFYLLDLRAPFVLALLLGSISAVPYLGALLGGIPALLVAAAEPHALVLISVFAFVIVLQVVEARFVRRHVDPRTIRVGPALVLAVAIIAFQLYGYGGAVYGVVALVFLLALLEAWSVIVPRPTPGAS
jgi:predicted PurR-regulated permease PerM